MGAALANHLSTEIERRLLERELEEAMPALGAWFGAEQLGEQLLADMRRVLDRARLIALGGGGFAIAEPRDWAENERLPHVMILHRSFAADDESAATAVRSEAAREFGEDHARRLCTFRWGVHEGKRVRTHYVAGMLRRIHLPPDTQPHPELRLVAPDRFDYYETYLRWYEEFWRQRPELKARVPVESEEDLRAFHEQGGSRLIQLGETVCGLLAAERRSEFGLTGWRIREKVIAPAFWGRGLSNTALVEFARSLPGDDRDAIWGTIVPGNDASLSSALRTGRRIVGSLHWV
jgi:hypothetical protein